MEEGGSGGGGPMPTVCLCVLSSTPRSETDDRLIEDEIDDAMDDDMEETGDEPNDHPHASQMGAAREEVRDVARRHGDRAHGAVE